MKTQHFFLIFILFFISRLNVSAQEKTDTIKARNQYNEAVKCFSKAEYTKSSELYNAASLLFEKYNRWDMYLTCRNGMAEVLIREENYKEAQKIAENNIVINNEKLKRGNLQEAESFNILGFIQLNQGRDDLALENFKKTSRIYAIVYKGNESRMALCYNNLALVYWNRGNQNLALEYHEKALSIRKEIFGEIHPDVAASYNNIGLIYASIDTKEALLNYEKALEIYRRLYGSEHPNIAIAYTNIGILDREAKKYETALDNFSTALAIYKNLYGENSPRIALINMNIGLVCRAQKEYETSLEYQTKALQIYKNNYGTKHQEIASVYNAIGTVYAEKGEYASALENYQKAICANIPDFNEENIEINPPISQYYNADLLLVSLLLKANVIEQNYLNKTLKIKELELGMQTLELCEQLIEDIRELKTNKSDKIALGAVAFEVYEAAIRTSLTLGDISLDKKNYKEKAFDLAEKSKSSVLLGAISDIDAKQFANIPVEFIEKEKQLKIDITFYEQEIGKGVSANLEKEYRDALFNANRAYDEFIKNLEQKFPAYYNLKYDNKIVSITQIQEILDKETVLISYFIAEKNRRLYIFEITKQGFKVYDVPMAENFDKYIIAFRKSIYQKLKSQYQNFAFILYKQLFPVGLGSGKEKMIIIPDGKLGIIPFEALLYNKANEEDEYINLPYLVNQKTISYHYSATLLYQTIQKNAQNTYSSNNIFLCAPINFNKISNLPGTEEEVQNIRDLFVDKSLEAKPYTFLQAQESMVKSGELKKYKYLHFATHGLVDEENPEMSQIFLANDDSPKEDGHLFSGEIYNLEIKADLVTLSACQTGLGKISKGEGIIGLTRALLFAGAKNMLVSFWSVSDASTSRLMIDFYNNRLKNLEINDYAGFLRSSKIKMIAGENFANPYYWAPFVLIGK